MLPRMKWLGVPSLAVIAALVLSACGATPMVAVPSTLPAPAQSSTPTLAPTGTVTGTMTAVVPTATGAASPVTLRLANADDQGDPSASSMLEFAKQVQTRSNGSMVIEVMWAAGDSTAAGFEQGVLAAVKDGQYDLGLAAARAWEAQGIPVFQPLQTPFLIDSDALAIAVANSDVAAQMLDGLPASGIVGLAIWPEDLRHPSAMGNAQPLLSPDDFRGQTIRTTSTGITDLLIKALGGNPVLLADSYEGAESGLRQGKSLNGRAVATGNVVFFPKYQVLFANGAAFDKLTEEQRAILRDAAAATREMTLANRPSDVEAATEWCADGGAVALASPVQLAALEKAVQPVIDQVEADPSNAKVVAAIRTLKAATQSGPAITACGTVAGAATPTGEAVLWSKSLPPNGVWRAALSVDDFVRFGGLRSVAEMDWAGVYTITLESGDASVDGLQDTTGTRWSCPATYQEVGDVVRLTYLPQSEWCRGEVDDLQWRLDDAGRLILHVVQIRNAPEVYNRGLYEAQPWEKVDGK